MVSFNFTAADIPAAYREDAVVVGRVGARALQADPRVSYCMYVPQRHYSNILIDNVQQNERLPLVVNVHGTERRAELGRDLLVPFAEANRCAVLAPLFPCSIGAAFDLDNYKACRYGEMRFDLLLLAILDEVAAFWPGIDTEKVYMMGFSGGGQFTHRFLLLHPGRLHAVSIGAPGRPTMMDSSKPWPQGIANFAQVFDGKSIDANAMQRVKAVQLIIGEYDTDVSGRGLFEWLAKHNNDHKSIVSQGSGSLAAVTLGRRQMIELVQRDLASYGVETQLTVVPGAAHEAPDMLPWVCKFWESYIGE